VVQVLADGPNPPRFLAPVEEQLVRSIDGASKKSEEDHMDIIVLSTAVAFVAADESTHRHKMLDRDIAAEHVSSPSTSSNAQSQTNVARTRVIKPAFVQCPGVSAPMPLTCNSCTTCSRRCHATRKEAK